MFEFWMERSILIRGEERKKAKEAKLVTCLSYAVGDGSLQFPLASLGMEHDAAAPSSKLIASTLSSPCPVVLLSALLYSEKFLVWMIVIRSPHQIWGPSVAKTAFF